jgi:glutathione synthase/RimK-type ligase-like ATP-grasp enzyme
MFTSTVARQQLQELEHHMAPTLLQGHVKKRFDIRTFFLDGTCYSVAIRSQKDAQTQIDFRNFNWDHPNRSLPYRLGEEVHKKIRTFMAAMRLETGSLDFVLSENEDLFFLEVNPVGQFGMVSEPGNYYLEKEMAEFLIRKAAS